MSDKKNQPDENTGISCKEAMSRLYQYLDNQLDGVSEDEIESHVHDCRECFSRVDFEKSLRQKVMDSVAVKTPVDAQERLKSLIDKF